MKTSGCISKRTSRVLHKETWHDFGLRKSRKDSFSFHPSSHSGMELNDAETARVIAVQECKKAVGLIELDASAFALSSHEHCRQHRPVADSVQVSSHRLPAATARGTLYTQAAGKPLIHPNTLRPRIAVARQTLRAKARRPLSCHCAQKYLLPCAPAHHAFLGTKGARLNSWNTQLEFMQVKGGNREHTSPKSSLISWNDSGCILLSNNKFTFDFHKSEDMNS